MFELIKRHIRSCGGIGMAEGLCFFLFFFSSRRRHTRCSRDWSSDVCSSDLVIGGELLTVASAEYQHYFLPNWGAAVFVDGGDAFFRRQFRLNVGAGIGARWRSPLGLLRLDIGYPVDSPFKHKIRLHIQVGPDL